MKAYLSDRHHDGQPGYPEPWVRVLGSVFGSPAAVQEAERILEDTEPGTKGWGLVPYYTIQDFVARDSGARLCGGLLVGSEYGEALADALEAIVDTEDTGELIAWLRVLQSDNSPSPIDPGRVSA